MAEKNLSLSEAICITVIITILMAAGIMVFLNGGIFPKADAAPDMAIEQSNEG